MEKKLVEIEWRIRWKAWRSCNKYQVKREKWKRIRRNYFSRKRNVRGLSKSRKRMGGKGSWGIRKKYGIIKGGREIGKRVWGH